MREKKIERKKVDGKAKKSEKEGKKKRKKA